MGVGTQLLKRLLKIGREEGVKTVVAYMLPENRGMRHVSQRLGFKFERDADLLKATMDLTEFDPEAVSEDLAS